MKYFRTKEGRIVENRCGNKTDWLCGSPGTIQKYYSTDAGAIWEKDIIKQADIIEELCDAFIIIDEDKKRYVYLKESNWTFDMIQDLGMWSDRTCYGAIWLFDRNGVPTLKSVAKMNESGVFELL